MAPQGAREIEVFVICGEREGGGGGGGAGYNNSKDPHFFGRFPQEVRDQGRVWGLVEHFYKDLLVFGCGFLLVLCK